MPKEFVLSHDEHMTQFVRPDENGFTTRTVFHDTEAVVDQLQRERAIDPKPRSFSRDGVCYRKVGSIPAHVIHQFYAEHKRWPNSDDLLAMLRNSDYSKLRATEEKF